MVSPVTPTRPWKIGDKADDPLFLHLSSIIPYQPTLPAFPACQLCGFNSQGLPVSILAPGRRFNEEILLRAAYNLEQRAGVAGKKPVIA